MKYLLIVDSLKEAERLQRSLGTPDRSFTVCAIGAMIGGIRFDRVILRDCADRILNRSGEGSLDIYRAKAQGWFKEMVQTRLDPDGEIIRL